MPTYRVLAATLLLLFGTTLAAKAVHGANFRVDNAVYAAGQSQPQSQGVTIFYEGLVYDFLNEPAEVIVFDKAHRRFVLLDITRHVRSEISIDDIQSFANRVKQRLSGHPNPHIKWMGDPSFEESFDRENSALTLKSPTMTYKAQLQAVPPAMAAQYHEFSDWYAQFNSALNPSSRPPFPRMMLNEAVERHNGVSKEVLLTTLPGPNGTATKITSRHQLAGQLDAADMNRLTEADDYRRSFQSVPFREYRQGK
jgi:hypothetical protein